MGPGPGTVTRPLTALTVLAALAALAALLLAPAAPAAPAGFNGDNVIRERSACLNGSCGIERAYLGPTYLVKPGTTNSDAYYCPAPYSSLTSWVALPEDDSNEIGYSAYSLDDVSAVSKFHVKTHNWGLEHTFRARVMWTCTNDTRFYAPLSESIFSKLTRIFSDPIKRAIGRAPIWAREMLDWLWNLFAGRPQVQAARAGGNSFGLRNGSNVLAISYDRARRSLPPAVYLTTRPADADCRARRMLAPVIDSSGAVRLDLFCRGLRNGGVARLRVGRPLVSSFPLRGAEAGDVDIRLDKPPGDIAPFVRLSTRPNHLCGARNPRLQLGERELRIRLEARCHGGAGATGQLYVGGLLSP